MPCEAEPQGSMKPKAALQAPHGACFVNISNHSSDKWEAQQTAAALSLAEHIIDIPFPAVPPEIDEKTIEILAEECISKVPPLTTHALIQGEFTLTFVLVRRLQARHIVCLAATSERQVEEAGDGRKTFRFVRFRKYPSL